MFGSGGIRTHAPEETGALNQRLRPLGHATCKGAGFAVLQQARMHHASASSAVRLQQCLHVLLHICLEGHYDIYWFIIES